jgi:hypothetical protein
MAKAFDLERLVRYLDRQTFSLRVRQAETHDHPTLDKNIVP